MNTQKVNENSLGDGGIRPLLLAATRRIEAARKRAFNHGLRGCPGF